MQRDNQPIHNIGFGVTSRDIRAERNNEDIISSPDSSFISKALDGNHFTKMATAMIATGIAATVAGKVVKNQGLKLGFKLTTAARSAEASGVPNVISRAHSGLLRIRNVLDRLEGVTRVARGAEELVFSEGGALSTGYKGVASYIESGYDAVRKTGVGQWAWRDELQQSLVRQARRLPYEVPAFYVADKTIGRAIHGQTENDGPRKKWYDPTRLVDIGKDLAKTAAMQMGGFMLPTAVAGASKNSSLNFLRTAEQRWDSAYGGLKQLTPVQRRLYQSTNFLQGSLSEVGQDVINVLDKTIKFSERSSGALSLGLSTINSIHKNPVQDIYAARHGVPPGSPSTPRTTNVRNLARDIYRGNKTALNNGLADSAKIDTLLDLIPGYKSIRQGLIHGAKEYKNLKAAQIFLDTENLTAAQQLIISSNKLGQDATDAAINPILRKSIDTLNRKRTSPLITLAQSFEEQVGLATDPFGTRRGAVPFLRQRNGTIDYTSEQFKKELFDGEYRRRLASQLHSAHGVDKKTAERFANQLYFDELPFKRLQGQEELLRVAPEERITIGGRKPESDFFQTILNRFNEGKIGNRNRLSISEEQFRSVITDVDNSFERGFAARSSSIYGNINIGRTAARLAGEFEEQAGGSVLRQTKLKESDFDRVLARLKSNVISKTDTEFIVAQERLARAVAQTMGIPTKDVRPGSLLSSLRSKGIDPSSLEQMQGYLLRNKKMTSSQFGSVSEFFGGKGLLLSSNQEKSFLGEQQRLFNRLYNQQNPETGLIRPQEFGSSVYSGNIAFVGNQQIATNPITQIIQGIGATAAASGETSTVRGFYQFGDKVINFNPIAAGLRKTTEFLASEVRIPVIGINPLQMLGIKDFQTMSQAGKFRVSSAVATHPFIPNVDADGFTTDLYTWHSTGGIFGTKGKLTAHRAQRVTSRGTIEAKSVSLPGTYRPLPTRSTGMFARTAELAAGEKTTRPSAATGFFGKIREKLDYDPEQPNSLFRYVGRLANRQADINNDAIIARLASGSVSVDEPFSIGGFGRKRDLVLRELKEKDQILGYELRNATDNSLVASHGQLMESFTRFADTILTFGFNKRVTAELFRAADSPLLTSVGTDNMVTLKGIGGSPSSILGSLDDVLAPKTASQGARLIETLESDLANLKVLATSEGASQYTIDQYTQAAKAFSRIRKYSGVTDFSVQSPMFESSASIVTKGDEMGFEVGRYLLQRNALFNSAADSASVLSSVTSTIDDLSARGVLSAAQTAESKVAAFSTGLNIAAFKTYKYESGSNAAGNLINTLNRFKEARGLIGGTNASLADPFANGEVAAASRGSLNPLAKISPFFKKNLGMGKYVEEIARPSALSGGTEKNPYTFIPTFGTAFNRNPKAALMSAAGIHTYGNEEGFSLASVPMSVGFQRLNRYFGTVGSGLKESNFYGPLDLYFRGMVGERILPATIIGASALTVDRTLGGYTQRKDERGERVYSPLVLGTAARIAVEGQAIGAGLTPGGMGYSQKKEQLLHGEVPIRKGRFWPLGNTPFKGGKIEYYRPSWYRRLQGGAMFTSDTYGSPIEKFLYYNDFSPLRPFDPYRFERKHYEDRPYPVTGEYFSGPYGAAVPILNATVGRILKPQKIMHPDELNAALAEYQPVGQSGAYLPTTSVNQTFVQPQNAIVSGTSSGALPTEKNPFITRQAAPVYGREPVPLRNIPPNLSLIGAKQVRS